MNMIHSSRFQGLSVVDRYFFLARGYLEGSRVLCEAMLNDDFTPQFSNSQVILYLCRHAVELFLKGAIASVPDEQPPQTHNLKHLVDEYERVLPNQNYRFAIPFVVEVSGSLDLFAELEENHHKTLGQRYRYPTDRNGKPFSEPEGFLPAVFLSDLINLSKSFLLVERRLKGTIS